MIATSPIVSVITAIPEVCIDLIDFQDKGYFFEEDFLIEFGVYGITCDLKISGVVDNIDICNLKLYVDHEEEEITDADAWRIIARIKERIYIG